MRFFRVASLAVLCVALLCALAAFAQEQGPPAGQQDQPRRGPMMMSPQERLDMLTKELNLTDEQKNKIKPILENEQKQMQDMRANTAMSREDRMAKMRETRTKTNDDIKAVLTDEQKKKYDDMVQRMRRGPGGPGGPPGGPGGPPGF